MPTDLCGVLARQRETRQEYHSNTSIMLVSLIIALANVILLFADQALARAVVQMAQF